MASLSVTAGRTQRRTRDAICDHLRRTFPSVSVFMDVGAISPGADFIHAIDANLAGSGVVLAVIGPHWGTIRDSKGQHACRRSGRPRGAGAGHRPPASGQRHSASGRRRTDAFSGHSATIASGTLPPPWPSRFPTADFAEDAERLCKAISDALGLSQDDEQYRERIEYSRFFSDAESDAGAHQVSSPASGSALH